MSFAVSADAYDRFMGRYSSLLGPLFADFAGVAPGMRAVDVGCGPGALTGELARRLGPEAVAAVDPSESFVAAVAERNPGVDVRRAPAEELPFADDTFDVALAQLVVNFMADPLAGVREMARVSRPGAIVATCVWDHGSGRGPLSPVWEAARSLDAAVTDESRLFGANEGQLAQVSEDAGLLGVEETTLAISVEHATFEEWWEPFTLGVGPVGVYIAKLDEPARERLRERCRERLGAPFVMNARVWASRGTVA